MNLKNIIFMGTPQFAVPSLSSLSETRFKPVICITQPDAPQGRKRKLTPPIIKLKATELNIPVMQPENINAAEFLESIAGYEPDLIITAAYGNFLHKKLRNLPQFGCLNIHPSLLPKYRGAAPINYSLFNNESVTGNTIFKIVKKMDAGPIIFQSKIMISDKDCYTSLQKKLSEQSAVDILAVLRMYESGEIKFIEQDERKVSYSAKIGREDTFIDWGKDALTIHNQVRGLAEKPAAVSSFRNKRLKIIETEIFSDNSKDEPGAISQIIRNSGFVVAAQNGELLIKRVQPAGKKIMKASDYLLGARIKTGEFLSNGF